MREPRRAVFLDRDGVINEEVEYLGTPEALRLVPGAAAAIRRLNAAGLPVVVVTNQAGVARGYYPEAQVAVVHAALAERLAAEGAAVDGWYYCPHHPTAGQGGYRVRCTCRKPEPGLLHAAARDLGLTLTGCVMVGDKASDLEAGRAAGCATVLVETGYGVQAKAAWPHEWPPDLVAADLAAAVPWIVARLTGAPGAAAAPGA